MFLLFILFAGFVGFVGMFFVLGFGSQTKSARAARAKKIEEDRLLREAELKRARQELGESPAE